MQVTCINCKYDLIGTARSGTCPECGHAAEASYAAFDKRQARPPHHPAARLAMVVSALGAFAALAILLRLAITNGDYELEAIAFEIGIAIWHVSPFLGLAGLAMLVGRQRTPSIAALIVTILVTTFAFWAYGEVLRLLKIDPLAGLTFLFLLIAAWVVVGPALLIGAYFTKDG